MDKQPEYFDTSTANERPVHFTVSRWFYTAENYATLGSDERLNHHIPT